MQAIENLVIWLTEAFGPLGPVYMAGAIGLLLIGSVMPILLARKVDPLDKIARPAQARPDARARAAAAQAAALRRDSDSAAGLFQTLAPIFEPKDADKVSSTRQLMLQAGYRSRSAVKTYYLARGLGAVTLGGVALLYMLLTGEDSPTRLMLFGGGAFLIGYLAPSYWVNRRRQGRQEEIGNGFPDALDMMLICVEAGQSLDQSLLKVADEISHAHPALAEEFQIVSLEMRAGKERASVLRDFAARAGVSDVSSFVTVLIQSTQFGTSVGEALRVYAAEMRDKRIMRAEEKANTLPTKLTLGTMFFTVPPLMLILIGPSLVDIIKVLGGRGG